MEHSFATEAEIDFRRFDLAVAPARLGRGSAMGPASGGVGAGSEFGSRLFQSTLFIVA